MLAHDLGHRRSGIAPERGSEKTSTGMPPPRSATAVGVGVGAFLANRRSTTLTLDDRGPGSHDPPRRPRCVLRVRGTAPGPLPAPTTDRRGRGRGARRLIRGQGLRGALPAWREHGRASCARTSVSSPATSATTSVSATRSSTSFATSPRWSSGSRSTRRSSTSPAPPTSSGRRARSRSAIRRRVRAEIGLPVSVGVARTKHLAKVASQVAKPDGLVVVEPEGERAFLEPLPVELLWGVGPVTGARLADAGIQTIGDLCAAPGVLLEHVLGHGAGHKLALLASNVDPRRRRGQRRAASVGAQAALGRRRATPDLLRVDARLSGGPGGPAVAGDGPQRPHGHGAGALQAGSMP